MPNYILFVIGLLLGYVLRAIEQHKPTSNIATKILFNAEYLDTHVIMKGITKMILQDAQKVKLTIAPVDAAGNPATVEGVPVWVSSDESVLSVVADADGMSAYAIAVGPLGDAQVAVTADADLGPGVVTLTGTLDVTVVAGQAVSLAVAAGAPEPK